MWSPAEPAERPGWDMCHPERERELLTRADRQYIGATISEGKEEHTEVIHTLGEQFPAVHSSRDRVRSKLGNLPHCSRQPTTGQVFFFLMFFPPSHTPP